MASCKGVKVEIISNGEVLPMYDDPDVVEMDEVPVPQYFIEATTGATFSIRVTLTRAFERGPCDAVRVYVNFDGDRVSHFQDLLKEGMGALLREAEFKTITFVDSVTDHWVKGKLIFAKLETSKAQSFVQRS